MQIHLCEGVSVLNFWTHLHTIGPLPFRMQATWKRCCALVFTSPVIVFRR